MFIWCNTLFVHWEKLIIMGLPLYRYTSKVDSFLIMVIISACYVAVAQVWLGYLQLWGRREQFELEDKIVIVKLTIF